MRTYVFHLFSGCSIRREALTAAFAARALWGDGSTVSARWLALDPYGEPVARVVREA